MEEFHRKMGVLFSHSKLRRYRKRDIILHEEDTPNMVYYVKSGYLRLYSYSKDGEELTRILLGPKDLFPIRYIIAHEPIDYYSETITPSECFCVSKNAFITFIKKDPDLMLDLTKYLVNRMGLLYKRMEYFAFGNAYQKIAIILDDIAKRFGKKSGKTILIDIPLTQKDIAAMVGLSRETTNIELERLRKKSIIEHVEHHHIKVLDLKKLEEESRLY